MKDPLWQAVYNALRPLLNGSDVILAPRGDWPPFPCSFFLYDDFIEIGDATVLILHKGQLTSLPKVELRRITDEWQWIFANEVFIVLSRSEKTKIDVRRGSDIVHCRPLIRFLCSASLRKRHSKIVYVHVPKTGGTSMWASLTRAFPSHVFYPSIHAYLSHPPAPEDYDLIGLHFSPSFLLPSLSDDDWVIGMVRHPTQRFLSGVMHSRRTTADPKTFTPSAMAMREMELTEYLATDFGRYEARLQLVTFGTDLLQSSIMPSDEVMLSSAVAFSRRDNVFLAPSERSPAFREFLAKRLSFRRGALGRLNVNEPAMRAAHSREFSRAVGRLNAINSREREFYDFVCHSFGELCRDRLPPRRMAQERHWYKPLAGYVRAG
jgi:hypothetical protein